MDDDLDSTALNNAADALCKLIRAPCTLTCREMALTAIRAYLAERKRQGFVEVSGVLIKARTIRY